ncbi:hypothetical protein GZ77_13355 [Endozoicomonas montiporae]|uniref:Right handed beta helix domain-containing protein n=2 Tax=Endozoicomonas montiporae TaxID=1027273 RepID=A0A081N4L0_9GAMM|nr:hypothetical protein [Endozoicomonas montiporae]AMO57752.1 hypothetical protein EZMO1_3803 [Endozoicomonas montiporae CL-33]KEQ13383.1 hypothetical protein GZ77_13355 [Endozoicomonas montiporae]
MRYLEFKKVARWFVYFCLFCTPAELAFARGLSSTVTTTNLPTNGTITTPTVTTPAASLADKNAALCDSDDIDTDDKDACLDVMRRLSALSREFKKVKVYTEGWFFSEATTIDASSPDTVHIISGNLTLKKGSVAAAKNIAIMGYGKPKLWLTSSTFATFDSVIDLRADDAIVDGLQIDPKGYVTHITKHAVNHFIKVSGNNASINNVSLLNADLSGKAVIHAVTQPAEKQKALKLTDIDYEVGSGIALSSALIIDSYDSVFMKNIRNHNLTPDCMLFLLKDVGTLNMQSVTSYIDNTHYNGLTGIVIVYTQARSDLQLLFKNVDLKFEATELHPPVIIAAKETISGTLTFTGRNTFDTSSIRYPEGLIVHSETGPTTAPFFLKTTSTGANTNATPEYWWSELPSCALETNQIKPYLHSGSDTPDSSALHPSSQLKTPTPALTSTPELPAMTITPGLSYSSESVTTTSTKVRPEPARTLSSDTKSTPKSSTLTLLSTLPNKETSGTKPQLSYDQFSGSLSPKGVTTRNTDTEISSKVTVSTTATASGSDGGSNLNYLHFLWSTIPTYIVTTLASKEVCVRFHNKAACYTAVITRLGLPYFKKYGWFMNAMYGDLMVNPQDMQMNNVQPPEQPVYDDVPLL